MALPRDSVLTPIRVKGKRRSTWAEKWHTGKRRKPELQKRRAPCDNTSTPSTPTSVKPGKRHRRGVEAVDVALADKFSPLENLPAEVVQQIFEYSINIDLPLTSCRLAMKLSDSQHLQYQLTSYILGPILGFDDETATAADLSRATRLLNSRFMTWDFFVAWLQAQQPILARSVVAEVDCVQLWMALQPSRGLLPPKKLLCPPITQDKSRFLAVLALNVDDISTMDAAYGELAQEGLLAAVESGQHQAVVTLLDMGLDATTELLRVAVVDSGCDKEVVRMLVGHNGHSELDVRSENSSTSGTIDLLDPVLWAWAHKNSNGKGEWLMRLLRAAQRTESCPET